MFSTPQPKSIFRYSCPLAFLLFLLVLSTGTARGLTAKETDTPEDLEDHASATNIFIWHASTLHAAGGKLTYFFEVMAFETREFEHIVLSTNMGEAAIETVGGAGYNRNNGFQITSAPADSLEIKTARDDGSDDILARFNPDLTAVMGKDFNISPHPFRLAKTHSAPSELLQDKSIRISLAPTIPAMQMTGVYVFTLESEPGMPPVENFQLSINNRGAREKLDTLESGMTTAGTWYARVRYEAVWNKKDYLEGDLEGDISPASNLTVPDVIVVTGAKGMIHGERVNLFPSLRAERFTPMPIKIVLP